MCDASINDQHRRVNLEIDCDMDNSDTYTTYKFTHTRVTYLLNLINSWDDSRRHLRLEWNRETGVDKGNGASKTT